MTSTSFCPISFKKIDEHAARLTGFFAVILLAIYIWTGSLLPIVFLVYDFLVRGLERPSLSLLSQLSKWVLSVFNFKPLLINAGPKLFAARVGLIFSLLVLIAELLNWSTAALIITGVFGLCALLEAVAGFCVACKLYPLIYRLTYQRSVAKNNCETDFQI